MACARLYYERKGRLEALDYHQGWNKQSGGNILNLVSGEWVLGKAGKVYRDFAPLFYGRWGDLSLPDTDKNLVVEAFVSEDKRYAVAFVNKNDHAVTTSLGLVAKARSYGVIYYGPFLSEK